MDSERIDYIKETLARSLVPVDACATVNVEELVHKEGGSKRNAQVIC